MRLVIWIACLLLANAASFGKRVISAPIQLCIDDISAVFSQVYIVKIDAKYMIGGAKQFCIKISSTKVLAFTRAGGYSAVVAIHSKKQVLETNLKKLVQTAV